MTDEVGQGAPCQTCRQSLDNCCCFTVGDQVRFIETLDPGDELCLFDVVEDNGDRLMIELICDLPIRPVQAVRRADVCIASVNVERR